MKRTVRMIIGIAVLMMALLLVVSVVGAAVTVPDARAVGEPAAFYMEARSMVDRYSRSLPARYEWLPQPGNGYHPPFIGPITWPFPPKL